MKNIHEILAGLGVTVPEDKKGELDKQLLENYKTVADYEKQTGKLKLAEDKVKTTEEALKQFDGVDVAQLKQQVEKLTGDLAAKDAEYQGKLTDLEFDRALEGAIAGAKGKSAKAIKALLDTDALKQSKNQSEDMKAALDKLRESDGYLFDTPAKQTTGLSHQGGHEESSDKNDEVNAAIRAAFGREN